jgi:hypothetical protein
MGIFEFVFGKSAPKEEDAPKQAYYLNDDDAKSFGNIEYMRSTKTIRRTFAKKKGQEHLESVRQVSASKAAEVSDRGSFASISGTSASTGASSSAPAVPQTPARRRASSSSGDMDMFRNMAKTIRK